MLTIMFYLSVNDKRFSWPGNYAHQKQFAKSILQNQEPTHKL
jgi:hypothetical protein